MIPQFMAVAIALGLHPAAMPPAGRVITPVAEASKLDEAAKPDDIRAKLMDTLHAMNASNTGVFHDDVSAIVAPIFPPGQTFAETQHIVHQQKLGELMMFKGTQEMRNGKMYVTRAGLMGGMVSDVDVIIDFDFVGTNESNMVLQSTKAFLHGTGM